MHTFTRGQKGRLSDLGLPSRFEVRIEMQAGGSTIEISCFGLDAAERLGDECYMVFYNQLTSPPGEVSLSLAPGRATFRVDLEAFAKLVFTAALDDGGTMRDCDLASMRLGDAVVVTLTGADFASEKAVILGELYRKDGQWRFGAVGQGFDGRLSALLKHFGGLEAPARSPVVTPEGEAGSQKVSLSKITPEKRGDKISLEKRRARDFGRVYVNLNWHRQPAGEPARKFIGKLLGPSAPRGVDLDLGCQYELSDGRKGVVQALGEAWGSIDNRPYICLDGDDRTGSDEGGENMYVNGDRFDQIRRI